MRKSRFLSRVFVSMFVAAMCGSAAAATTHPSGPCTPPGAWEARADFADTAIVRAWGTYFPADGKFYLFGGRPDDVTGDDFINVHIYDPATDTWTASNATFSDNQTNNMVGGVLDFGGTPLMVVVGGSAAGATDASSSDTRTYDPVGDSLQVLTNDPWVGNITGKTLPGGAAVYENKLFVFGGFDINTDMVNTITVFDPSAAEGSRWTTMTATLPTPIGYVPAATSNGLIYLFGGSTWDASDPTAPVLHDTTESSVYDPDTDTISPVTAIPRATGETRAVTAPDGTVWVLGGGREAPNPSSEVDVYDPVGDAWTTAPAFVNPRRNISADIDPATGNIWVVGGYDSGGAPSFFNEQFTACQVIDDTIFEDGFDGPPT
jgi:Kelch motif protein